MEFFIGKVLQFFFCDTSDLDPQFFWHNITCCTDQVSRVQMYFLILIKIYYYVNSPFWFNGQSSCVLYILRSADLSTYMWFLHHQTLTGLPAHYLYHRLSHVITSYSVLIIVLFDPSKPSKFDFARWWRIEKNIDSRYHELSHVKNQFTVGRQRSSI